MLDGPRLDAISAAQACLPEASYEHSAVDGYRPEAQGVRSLGTSTPPQSPVAWSNFITGRNPGGHGVFDFIHRDAEKYEIAASTVKSTEIVNCPSVS